MAPEIYRGDVHGEDWNVWINRMETSRRLWPGLIHKFKPQKPWLPEVEDFDGLRKCPYVHVCPQG